jgi:hypothetical protein
MAYVLHGDEVHDHGQPAAARPRRRTRNQGRRSRTVRFALTDAEYAELSDAALRAGLARGAYAAEAALSVARGVVVTPDAPLRDAFYALDRAALLVRKIGVNLNQARRQAERDRPVVRGPPPVRPGERPPRGPAGGGRGRPAEAIPPGHPRTRSARAAIPGSARHLGMTGWHPRSGADGIPGRIPSGPERPEWGPVAFPWPGPRRRASRRPGSGEGVGPAFPRRWIGER